MALISCPECKKQVSDKARSCPHCGCPIEEIKEETVEVTVEEPKETHTTSNEQVLVCPSTFPENLMIGTMLSAAIDTHIVGLYNQQENTETTLESGKVDVWLHTHGISISESGLGNFNSINIHNSQIISIKKTSSAEIVQANKVVGRAVVGGLIMGPIGAIVGGMSGIGAKDKVKVTQYMVINYWDIPTRTAKTLLIQCDEKQCITYFINKHKAESQKNITTGRVAETESNKGCSFLLCFALICLVLLIIVLAF